MRSGEAFGGAQKVAILATKLGLILRACHGTEDARRSGPDAAALSVTGRASVARRGSGTMAFYELSFPKSQYEPKKCHILSVPAPSLRAPFALPAKGDRWTAGASRFEFSSL